MTIKRCTIQLPDIFRVSKPGIDVDSAGEKDFLFHEDYLFTQPYSFQWVACPFAGNTSNNDLSATVAVTLPDVTDDPLVLLFPVRSDNVNVFPYPKSRGTGSSGSGFTTENWDVYLRNLTGTSLDLFFVKSSTTRRSPLGCWVVAMRKPNA